MAGINSVPRPYLPLVKEKGRTNYQLLTALCLFVFSPLSFSASKDRFCPFGQEHRTSGYESVYKRHGYI